MSDTYQLVLRHDFLQETLLQINRLGCTTNADSSLTRKTFQSLFYLNRESCLFICLFLLFSLLLSRRFFHRKDNTTDLFQSLVKHQFAFWAWRYIRWKRDELFDNEIANQDYFDSFLGIEAFYLLIRCVHDDCKRSKVYFICCLLFDLWLEWSELSFPFLFVNLVNKVHTRTFPVNFVNKVHTHTYMHAPGITIQLTNALFGSSLR